MYQVTRVVLEVWYQDWADKWDNLASSTWRKGVMSANISPSKLLNQEPDRIIDYAVAYLVDWFIPVLGFYVDAIP